MKLATIVLALLSATPSAAAPATPSLVSATGACGDDMGTKQVVILVHGFNSDQSTWTKVKPDMESAVHEASPTNVYVRFFDYGSKSTRWVTDAGIGPALAAFTRCLAKASKATGGSGKVILVGHSMGGLAIRCAMNADCSPSPVGKDEVGLIVTLGTPHAGSQIRPGPLADFASRQVGALVLSRCDIARFLANEQLNAFCDDVRALTVSPAGRAFTVGSHPLKVLGKYPPGIPVRAIAGSASWWSMGIGRWVSPRTIPMGDFVVSLSSQLLLHTDDRLGGTRTVDCGTATIGVWATCWHSTETQYTSFEREVRQSVKDYLKANPPAVVSLVLPPFGQSAENARVLEAFLRAGVKGLEPIAGSPGDFDRCRSIGVYGADLGRGALDIYYSMSSGGACGGDAAGTYYRIRDHKVVASAVICGDCGSERPTGLDLVAVYGRKPTPTFTIAATGAGAGWQLLSEPPRG